MFEKVLSFLVKFLEGAIQIGDFFICFIIIGGNNRVLTLFCENNRNDAMFVKKGGNNRVVTLLCQKLYFINEYCQKLSPPST